MKIQNLAEVPVKNRQRLPFLDGIRALAALWVVLGHCHLLTLGWTRSSSLWGRPLDVLLYMHLGVDIFLVLSGFCLALPIVHNSNSIKTSHSKFFKARALRILPPYYAALSLVLIINYFVPIASWGYHPVGLTADIPWYVIAVNFTLLQDIFPQYNTINGPFWSISTEWHLYFVFPLLVWILRKYGVAILLIVSVVAAFALTWLSFAYPQVSGFQATVPSPPYFIALFAMGVAAASFAFDPRFEGCRGAIYRYSWVAGAIAMIPLILLLWKYRIIDGNNVWGFLGNLHIIDPLTGLVAALFIVGLCDRRRPHRVLESTPLVFVGGFSYSLYLIHIPIVAAINKGMQTFGLPHYFNSPMDHFIVLAVVGTTTSLVTAWLFAKAFERNWGNLNLRLPFLTSENQA